MEFSKGELNNREKVAFELGIKLGAIFHQFIGTPVSEKTKDSLENSIEESIKNQPYVEDVEIKIDLEEEEEYTSLSPQEIDSRVIIEVEDKRGIGRLKYTDNYPLMWIDRIKEKNNS
ncbi:dihydroneopterin aldolase [archaeon SCG-AAA382B04]|nr:dihydroneopterin aldolase [archaeon SCG-AAA382B04]